MTARARRLRIELDPASSRFVLTLIDQHGQHVMQQFPDDAQLRFSRGVKAYVQAMQSALAADARLLA
jgi:uncharacterized FlaG/YvyC family protein